MGEIPGTERQSEEWEDWMDWNKTSGAQKTIESPTSGIPSPKGGYQLPSPDTSTTSELPPEKRKVSPSSRPPIKVTKKQNPAAAATASNKSHSIVEKRYRTNLNQKIAELGDCIPSLRGMDHGKECDGDTNIHCGESGSVLKHNKATVLTEGIAYVKYLERRNQYLEQANAALQEQSKLSKSIGVISSEEPVVQQIQQPSPDVDAALLASSIPKTAAEGDPTPPKPVQGMMKVPEEWRRLWRGELRTRSPERAKSPARISPAESSGAVKIRGGKLAGRVVLGSLGGLMVMDRFVPSHKEKSDERGLFALPTIRHLPIGIRNSFRFELPPSWNDMIASHHLELLAPFLEGFFIFGVLGLMLFIYLFTSRPPLRKQCSTPTPQPAPSISSPLEVRQRAFLTAIQTIWVPSHRVIPELLALNIETAAYLIRQLLGWQMYSWLTGRSEDEEIARVRAWDIALDAQLCGGDPEISKSRLVLSLWASGTLPSSPARLMLKALHIRILFWEPSNIRWVTERLHKAARRLARWQWNKACGLHRELEKAAKSADVEPLTDHLKALLSQPSDDILDDAMIQRAHNLAWNTADLERDHAENSAMRGPLDALASWHSSRGLHSALVATIASEKLVLDSNILSSLDMAVHSAPRGSLGKLRALAAMALFRETAQSQTLRRFIEEATGLQLSETGNPEGCIGKAQSVVNELFRGDLEDLTICLECIPTIRLALEDTQHLGLSISELLSALESKILQAGLLGWTAVHQLALLASQNLSIGAAYKGAFKEALQHLMQNLKDSKDLDLQSQECIASSFERMMGHQAKARRRSEASDDTGYASMSDEEVKGNEDE